MQTRKQSLGSSPVEFRHLGIQTACRMFPQHAVLLRSRWDPALDLIGVLDGRLWIMRRDQGPKGEPAFFCLSLSEVTLDRRSYYLHMVQTATDYVWRHWSLSDLE